MASNNITSTSVVLLSRPAGAATKPSERPFSSASEMVTFITGSGDKKRSFIVHKEFACKHSAVWNTAFNGSSVEGTTQTYQLENTTGDAFQLLVQWLYQEKLDLMPHEYDTSHTTVGDIDECCRQDHILVELWILADKFLIQPLQNYVLTNLHAIQLTCGQMNPSAYQHIYENTSDDSPLRRFAVDQFAWSHDPIDMSLLDTMPVEMLKDIVSVLMKQAPANIRHRKAAAMAASDYYVPEDA